MGFASEKQLFETVVESIEFQHLSHLYPNTTSLVEPGGLFGIPDLVIASLGESCCDVKAFAFEMKLSNWQRALVQAFRYRSFAEMSFVVMDRKHVRPALAAIERFERAHIGLLSISTDGELFVHHQPQERKPYCDRTRAALEKMLRNTEIGQRITLEETDSTSDEGFGAAPHSFATNGRLYLYPIPGTPADLGTISPICSHSHELLHFDRDQQLQTVVDDIQFDLPLDQFEIS